MSGSYSGVFVAMVTPFDEKGELDETALASLLDFLISKKVNGIYAGGTTGEGLLMTVNQRKRLTEICHERCNGNVRLIVHVGDNSIENVRELASHARDTGADAIAAVPGSYYKPDEDAVRHYYSLVSSFTDLPLFIYHIPPITGVQIKPETVVEMMEEHSSIMGIKDSSGDFRNLLQLINMKPKDKIIFCGSDDFFLAGLVSGMDGCVSGYSNPFPESYVHLYKLFREGGLAKASVIQSRISEMRSLLTTPPIQPIKEALKLRGINAGFVKPPLRRLTEREIQKLKKNLRTGGAA